MQTLVGIDAYLLLLVAGKTAAGAYFQPGFVAGKTLIEPLQIAMGVRELSGRKNLPNGHRDKRWCPQKHQKKTQP